MVQKIGFNFKFHIKSQQIKDLSKWKSWKCWRYFIQIIISMNWNILKFIFCMIWISFAWIDFIFYWYAFTSLLLNEKIFSFPSLATIFEHKNCPVVINHIPEIQIVTNIRADGLWAGQKNVFKKSNDVYFSAWMFAFHKLVCQTLVISSLSKRLGLPDTVTKVITVLPFFDTFNKFSGLLVSICDISICGAGLKCSGVSSSGSPSSSSSYRIIFNILVNTILFH